MKAGDRGILSVPSRLNEFLDNVGVATEIGRRLGVQKFNALYGNRQLSIAASEQDDAALNALHRAAVTVSAINASVLLEPVSGVETYPLKSAGQARAVIDKVGLPNVEMLADLYHLFVNGDDVPTAIRNHIDVIGHVQIADAPVGTNPAPGRSGSSTFSTSSSPWDMTGVWGSSTCPQDPPPGGSPTWQTTQNWWRSSLCPSAKQKRTIDDAPNRSLAADSTSIAFIGLGVMGRPMASNLRKAGYRVRAYNRTASRADELVALGGSERPASRTRSTAQMS